MLNENLLLLKLDHVIEFIKDNTMLAETWDNYNLHVFLINRISNRVFERNCYFGIWEEVDGINRDIVLNRIYISFDKVPLYRIYGSSYQLAN